MQLSDLPKDVIQRIAIQLRPKDIIQLCLCSRNIRTALISNDEFWRKKSLRDFGDIFKLYRILVKATGLNLPTEISNKFKDYPKIWKHYYIQKTKTMNEADKEVLMDQGSKQYNDAKILLTTIQETRLELNVSMLVEITSKMLFLLDLLPNYAGCYYILATMLYMENQLRSALDVLDMGRSFNPIFPPFEELEQRILSAMQQDDYKGDGKKDVPLLVSGHFSPELLNVLLEIFETFDKDKDECLNPKELDSFVFSTNGQHPPPSFLKNMADRFGANEHGWLTKKGFLAFYLEQTLDDISETKKDLRAHNYDCSRLVKL
ncbi:hypothetical protein BDF20DRAFT_840747 [Mycotypha africana]|uniref:uncharacterized protein n=1 Tax=Mycotypha africana TaxID=64632 RepID=UPI00230177DA|nr:uncharacterized protein BDF20DRAFT_840747 [Mycotypha africana]KAI8990772.1 hypothetical protein BDF20DRAFT_840747 [Mycotypha africana]